MVQESILTNTIRSKSGCGITASASSRLKIKLILNKWIFVKLEKST